MTETLTPTQPKKGRYNNRPRRAGKEGPAGPGDQSLRRAALIAGSALLAMTVLSVYAYLVVIDGLVVDGDAARTASNIAEAEGRFRIGVACFALVAVLDVVVAWGLRVLRPSERDRLGPRRRDSCRVRRGARGCDRSPRHGIAAPHRSRG